MPLVVVEETKSEKEIPQEVKRILEKFVDVMIEELPHGLPPMRDIQHQIDLIPSLVFPNRLASIMSLKEHEELETQVDDLLMIFLIEGLFEIIEILILFSPCWCEKKMDFGKCVLLANLSATFCFMRK